MYREDRTGSIPKLTRAMFRRDISDGPINRITKLLPWTSCSTASSVN